MRSSGKLIARVIRPETLNTLQMTACCINLQRNKHIQVIDNHLIYSSYELLYFNNIIVPLHIDSMHLLVNENDLRERSGKKTHRFVFLWDWSPEMKPSFRFLEKCYRCLLRTTFPNKDHANALQFLIYHMILLFIAVP